MYNHVGAWAVRRGAVGVTMTYRLAPEHQGRAGAADVAAAVAWIRANIAVTAATRNASSCPATGWRGPRGLVPGLRGRRAVWDGGQGWGEPPSGIYDLASRGELEQAYYGDTPPEVVSALPGLLDCPVPLLFSVAERNPRYFHQQAAGVVAAWLARHGTTPHLVRAEGHNHISEIASLGIDDALGTQLGRFIDRITEPA